MAADEVQGAGRAAGDGHGGHGTGQNQPGDSLGQLGTRMGSTGHAGEAHRAVMPCEFREKRLPVSVLQKQGRRVGVL